MKELLQTVEKIRVDTESEAVQLIEEMKVKAVTEGYEIRKSSYTKKQKKSKGEIVAEWVNVEITKKFNDEVPEL
jgi:hypothetical protein